MSGNTGGTVGEALKADGKTDLVVVTVIPEEFGAVCNTFNINQTVYFPDGSPNLYSWRRGAVLHEPSGRHFDVVVGISGRPTNPSASMAINEAVERFRPAYVLLVGIAGGFPKDGIVKGDVVVSTFIYGYQYGKLGRVFQPRPHFSYQVDTGLLNAAQAVIALAPYWGQGIGTPPEDGPPPKCIPGLVASGDMVVDDADNDFFSQVLEHYPGVAAVEMEGAGAALAIQHAKDRKIAVGFLMIRGISDMPRRDVPGTQRQKLSHARSDQTVAPSGAHSEAAAPVGQMNANVLGSQSKERDDWKHHAARSAAHFAFHLISKAWPVVPQPQTYGTQIVSPTETTNAMGSTTQGNDGVGTPDQPWELFAQLYPLGPLQDGVWMRAGGEASRLRVGLRESGLAQWFSAIELVRNGGGGTSLRRLAETALIDHPGNERVKALVAHL